MSLDSILGLIQTALELGLISSLTVLALFLRAATEARLPTPSSTRSMRG